jgi:hypothetical protein
VKIGVSGNVITESVQRRRGQRRSYMKLYFKASQRAEWLESYSSSCR